MNGTDAVDMGTRFVATHKAQVHENTIRRNLANHE
ncbi:hypothetical protein SAMN06265360_13114 [Haloechinothrix alba]|uniref:Uncharacterized protein n=2 Tax=Haloechinothrix alba TaxID=664784 RepID=A0A239A7C2_9PSEU|nr:hypothetical protein SAMN06265360_13114 [Haloechinothrix alba]